MFNPLARLRDEFRLSPARKAARHFYHDSKIKAQQLRDALKGGPDTDPSKGFWYYGADLSGGLRATGIYPQDFPFGPRILMRRCSLEGMDCVDLGAMEGVIPVLMRRGGARKVVAADASFHCYRKMALLKKTYDVDFDFEQVGLMYDLSKKLKRWGGFDLTVFAGVLYHVFSPMHSLASVRPLLKKNSLIILSTNVINRVDMAMEFNDRGKLQTELNTFWYLTIPLFDYMLRYFKLLPLDCVYVPHAQTYLNVSGFNSGLLSVVCRATEDDAVALNDTWARESPMSSWEYRQLCDLRMMDAQSTSTIRYERPLDTSVVAEDGRSIDLYRAINERPAFEHAERPEDTYLLRLADQS